MVQVAPAAGAQTIHILMSVLSHTPFLLISSVMLIEFIPACRGWQQPNRSWGL